MDTNLVTLFPREVDRHIYYYYHQHEPMEGRTIPLVIFRRYYPSRLGNCVAENQLSIHNRRPANVLPLDDGRLY